MIPLVRFRRAILGTGLLLALSASSISAIPTPKGTSICDLPEYRGTAIYNKYCVPHAQRPSQTQDTLPTPPPGQAEARDLDQKGVDAYNGGNYESAAQFFQQALDKLPGDATIQQHLRTAKDQIAAKKRKSEEEFNQDKQQALNQLKGISKTGDFDSNSGLKGVGSTDLGLKDAPNSAASSGLKTLPTVNTDTRVVDARNVPTGLPRSVAAEIPDTPAGNRVRKGFQAIMDHDWNVARAWFQDALNHDPGNAGIQRLIELADYTMKRAKAQHRLVPPTKPIANTRAQEKAALATLHKQVDDQMNGDLANAFADFNRYYLPKHPALLAPTKSSGSATTAQMPTSVAGGSREKSPEEIKANWQAFFDAIFKKGQRYSAIGAVRD